MEPDVDVLDRDFRHRDDLWRGNGGDPTTLFFHVPDGMQIVGATLKDAAVDVRRSEPSVVAVDIPTMGKPVGFSLTFSRPLAHSGHARVCARPGRGAF